MQVSDLSDFLGVEKYNHGEIETQNRVGVVTRFSLD